MSEKRPLTPAPINKLDRQLIKNSPVTWSTRIHLAAYYGLAFSAIVILLSFVAPDDPRNDSTIYNWIILLSIVSLLAFVFWMIYLLRFNVFKRFGKWSKWDTVKTFLAYFIIITLIVSWPYIPPIVQSIRANMAYSSPELAGDVDGMNVRLCQLEMDSIDTRFSKDTLELKDTVIGPSQKDRPYVEGVDMINLYNYFYVDSAELKQRLENADSIRKLSDSIYLVYKCPDYRFISEYSIETAGGVKTKSSMDLYREILQPRRPVDKEKVSKELAALFSKYSWAHGRNRLTVDYHSDRPQDLSFHERINDKYNLHFVDNSIGNITDKKYRWDSEVVEWSVRSLYYIVLILSLLVMIYRHTTRKTFFLSILAAVVLTILTGLFMATSYTSGNVFFTWIIFYFILFAGLSITIVKSRHRNVVSGIALNLLVFLTVFMPLVVTGSYYTTLRERYGYSYPPGIYDHLFVNEELHFRLSEIGGFVLLIILLCSLYQLAYRKWYSLPEQ